MLIKEGLVQIHVPENSQINGPGKVGAGFYNRSQIINRDLTVLFIKQIGIKTFLDGFGSTGARGLRVEKETGSQVTICEKNPESFKYLERNSVLNKSSATLKLKDFSSEVREVPYDFIDVDPYGSVVRYADDALRNIRNGGYVAFTATDLSALTGSFPSKTFRRYAAHLPNDSTRHEAGIRTLIAYLARRAAVFDRYLEPQISFWKSHYYRVIIKVFKGSSGSDKMLKNIGFLNKHLEISSIYPSIEEGPLWTGKINNDNILAKMNVPEYIEDQVKLEKFLEMMRNEDICRYFIDLRDLGKTFRTDIPSFDAVFRFLSSVGILHFGRTEFSVTGLKIENGCDIFSKDRFSTLGIH
ncbi:tRNA (guanine-N2)-dimethyltransferase [Oxyplasma meridianum]|uniref:tRNA (guanine(26)-N(2))-dimethyltransferase n=1 Tax=Oxyplasma meridianum TaxID=3073602 RepID=A0AAX4NFM5_9ARCH